MSSKQPPWVRELVPEHILSIPPYLPGKPRAELERELGIADSVKMASNENPLGPSPVALEAIARHLSEVHVYPESSAPSLRSALASRFGLPDEAVILGNGSDEIVSLAAHVCTRPGDEALIGENTFSMYRICVRGFGGELRSVPLKNYRMDLTAMAAAVTPRTRLIFLANPNSPTGTAVSRADLDAFVRDLPRERLVLVIDEAYAEYVREDDFPYGVDYMGGEVPILVLRTFSKIYGLAGLRVGYGLSEPWFIELLNRVRPPFNVNSVAQVAAVAALRDRDHVERSRKVNGDGMQFLEEELAGLGLDVVPSQANFLTFCLDRDAGSLYQSLLREGVIVRHLASFGMARCIRVTVGKDSENRRFVTAMKKALTKS